MDLLEKYKKTWDNQPDETKQFSALEIYKLAHSKSSSIVKWIFIIGVLEFVILNSLYFVFDMEEVYTEYEKMGLKNFIFYSQIVAYVISFYFLVMFYLNYKRISTTDSTKTLMKKIIKTRKTVRNYVLFNLSYMALVMIAVTIASINTNFNDLNNKKLLKDNVTQFIAAYQHHGDLLASQMTLADLYRKMNDWDGVIVAYQKALLLVPSYVPALVNLADVYRMRQADGKAEKLLLKAITVTQDNARQLADDAGDIYLSALQQQASVEYALGLLYARNKDYIKASKSLSNATQLAPTNPDYFYAYLLILDGLNQREKALDILQRSSFIPGNEQLMALLRQWQQSH